MATGQTNVLSGVKIPIGQGVFAEISVESGRPLFILGRNGTGKSALMHRISGQLGNNVVYMPGSRPSYFESESLSLTPASRRQLQENMRGWDLSPDTRWRLYSATSRNEKAIHDLQAAETQYKIDAANEIKRDGSNSAAVTRLQSSNSPLDRVNAILAQANLPVSMLIEGGELRAKQSGSIYSFARMSDGERAALVFAAEVVAAPNGAIFVIDEPELHLHPSIVVPLLEALISERPECGFVVCTHELDLPSGSSSATLVLVRGSTWQGDAIATWEIDVLGDPGQIPEWLRVDLIGSRRKILFIEGTSTSLDQPLYALLFPSVSVRSRESCREVMRAVEGLRAAETFHRAQVFGLVDHDGMGAERVAELEANGIFPLPIFAVESLYYSADVLRVLADRQAQTLGLSVDQMIREATMAAITALKSRGVAEHLASRIAERQMRDQLLLAMPERQAMTEGTRSEIEITIASPYPAELDRINRMIDVEDVEAVVSRYPVRESGVLSSLARALHFNGRSDYERAALTMIGADVNLRTTLKNRLGNLTAQLA
ncbi:AAA family ATPase [Burkholderia sp. IDO3]|uniref:AAA family ATPase n=1 Tax=Burkholderia sp. IDO3 TaxID=1705310 RepID=UPI0011783190|nr:AAA family ATPase [Burkholderia sp. IDO3]